MRQSAIHQRKLITLKYLLKSGIHLANAITLERHNTQNIKYKILEPEAKGAHIHNIKSTDYETTKMHSPIQQCEK